jgi:hypothetical protein
MLRNKDMKLLRNYAIHPDDEVQSYRGDSVATAKTTLQAVPGSYKSGVGGAIQKKLAKVIPAFKPKSTMMFTKTISHNKVAAGKKVAWVNLTKRGGDNTGSEGAETIDVRGSFDCRKHWVPVYFLPWDYNGAIVSMTIPREGVIGPGSHILDPDILFTAAINGCSIFIQDSPENPTVYHAGGDTGRGKDMARGAAFWREVLTNFADLSKGKFQTEISRMDYIKTPGQLSSSGSLTTANAKAYRQWLDGHPAGQPLGRRRRVPQQGQMDFLPPGKRHHRLSEAQQEDRAAGHQIADRLPADGRAADIPRLAGRREHEPPTPH